MPLLALLLILACWAPELAPQDPPPGVPGPPPAVDALPSPPFQARTVTAPLTIVGPGGVSVAQLSEAELELVVLQVLAERVLVRCTGCPGAAKDAQGWLQRGAIRPVPDPGG